MMKEGVGCYNNDPNYTWINDRREPQKGPDYNSRFASLIFSPITAPINGIWWAANSSGKEEK